LKFLTVCKIAVLALFFVLAEGALALNGDRQLVGMMHGHEAILKTCDHDAGAICSIVWDGKELVNDRDKGRQIQTAITYDGMEESFNPTEAGMSAVWDGKNPSESTSRLKVYFEFDRGIGLASRMAYWNPVYDKRLSDHFLIKTLTFGYRGFKDVLHIQVNISRPEDEYHHFGKYEFTGYMPSEFSVFYSYEPAARKLIAIGEGENPEQPYPLIFSNIAGSHAMGILSGARLPQEQYPHAGYGRWKYGIPHYVVKWNTVQRFDFPEPAYEFQYFVFFGTLEQVQDSMTTVNDMVHGND